MLSARLSKEKEDYFLALQAWEEFQQDPATHSLEEIQEKYGLRKGKQYSPSNNTRSHEMDR
jgi:hypothetical protein